MTGLTGITGITSMTGITGITSMTGINSITGTIVITSVTKLVIRIPTFLKLFVQMVMSWTSNFIYYFSTNLH